MKETDDYWTGYQDGYNACDKDLRDIKSIELPSITWLGLAGVGFMLGLAIGLMI